MGEGFSSDAQEPLEPYKLFSANCWGSLLRPEHMLLLRSCNAEDFQGFPGSAVASKPYLVESPWLHLVMLKDHVGPKITCALTTPYLPAPYQGHHLHFLFKTNDKKGRQIYLLLSAS